MILEKIGGERRGGREGGRELESGSTLTCCIRRVIGKTSLGTTDIQVMYYALSF